ncbi:MAG TPA: AI-2E family transporter, partial [Planctomycetota bacterium]|nr:AI-2E family transporter [Planctomycetota bacterium]
VPIYAFYLLFELPAIHAALERWTPVRQRARAVRIAVRIGEVLAAYLRGRLLVSAIKGALLAVGLFAVGVPYSLLLGFLGGLLSIVPYVGGLIAFALAAVVALSAHPLLQALGLTLLVFVVVEALEGYVLMPKILGRDLGLSDVAVLFALTAGGAAFGLFGVLLALPLAATVKILFVELVAPSLEDWADEEDGGGVLRA